MATCSRPWRTKMKTKRCYVCQEFKASDEFGNNSNRADGKQTYCKICARVHQTRWYYKRVHGISLEDRDALLESQDGRCAICCKPVEFQLGGRSDNIGESAVLDHCHDTKQIRGVLCGKCNTGLGSFEDDEFSLTNAVLYLRRSGKK